MATLRTIAGPVMAAGFRLAGLPVDEARTAPDAATLLERIAADPDTGVILIEQEWFDAVPELLRRTLEKQPVPIVVPIPRVEWAGERAGAASYILDLLQRAIGYRVRLQ
jgi:vacuolar-type H+-ATPase subunit F/Vma7